MFKVIADHQAVLDVQSWFQTDKQSMDIAHGKYTWLSFSSRLWEKNPSGKQHYSNDFNVPGKFKVKLQSCNWRFVLLSQIHKHIVFEAAKIPSWKKQVKDYSQNSSYVNSVLFKQMSMAEGWQTTTVVMCKVCTDSRREPALLRGPRLSPLLQMHDSV